MVALGDPSPDVKVKPARSMAHAILAHGDNPLLGIDVVSEKSRMRLCVGESLNQDRANP